MKIEQLRFKNLNSLVGEWAIDFTHEAFLGDGIFAITGPTGAGKSTILDAMSLALYGRTPRLERINKSDNEIMNRQSGECSAEVTFCSPAGRFRATWSQRRARGKVDGKLQDYHHEFYDATDQNDQQPLTEKKSLVPGLVQEKSGLDFDQFTRSMLLAQGGFAKFLEAKGDERAPILEQITGTDIYSTISVAVHEREKAEREALDLIDAATEGIAPLGAEQLTALQEELERTSLAVNSLTEKEEQARELLQWKQRLLRLETDGTTARLATEECRAAVAAFAPKQEQLTRAVQAVELEAPYRELVTAEGDVATLQQESKRLEEALPQREAAAEEAVKAHGITTENLKKSETNAAEERAEITAVRALDQSIVQQQGAVKECNAQRSQAEKEQTDLQTDRDRLSALMTEKIAAAATAQRYLEQHPCDDALPEALAGFREQVAQVQQSAAQWLSTSKEVKSCTEQRTALEKESSRGAAAIAEVTAEVERLEAQLNGAQQQLDGATGAGGIAALRALREAAQERLQQLTEARTAQEQLAAVRQRYSELLDAQKGQLGVLEEVQETLRGFEAQRELTQRTLDTAERERRMLDFDAERQRLQEGEPCPLCGAVEHPFAHDLPTVEENQSEQEQLKTKLHSLQETLLREGKREATLQEAMRTISDQLSELKREGVERAAALGELLASLAVAEAAVPDAVAEAETAAATARERLSTAEAQQEVIAPLQRALTAARDAQEQASAAAQGASEQRGQLAGKIETLQQQLEDAKRQGIRLSASLSEALLAYGIADFTAKEAEQTIATLTARANSYTEHWRKADSVQQEQRGIEKDQEHCKEKLVRVDRVVAEATAREKAAEEALSAQQQDRTDRFGDRDCDGAEAAITAELKGAQAALQEAAKAQVKCESARQQCAEQLAQKRGSAAAKQEQRTALEKLFAAGLSAAGFATREHLSAALLPREQREALAAEAEALTGAQRLAEAKLQESTAALQETRDKALTTAPVEALELSVREASAALAQRNSAVGSLSQQLTEDAAKREKLAQKADERTAQERECRRWGALRELIGSADGKKFRNFAQGLTFELMVQGANRELAKMSDRYRLMRDPVEPLDLTVVDAWQGGEVRSTRNLSGGESFIVSLALALGLSQMASRTVRVDSLFLDEGFGTLDEEALEVALETLSGLQQEGKMIGVISHVQQLKERISTQITVEPTTGGRSRVVGPGCEKVE
ncbi:MAG: AAA family ATPase [bacterium]|nr:AAA family ATPase [bacterium]